LLLILALYLAYTAFFPTLSWHVSSTPGPAPACNPGDIRGCMAGQCNGTQSCSGGAWSACTLNIVCEPGAYVPCVQGAAACANGYKACDACGTGYGACLNKSG
jgi:hypothetical protein